MSWSCIIFLGDPWLFPAGNDSAKYYVRTVLSNISSAQKKKKRLPRGNKEPKQARIDFAFRFPLSFYISFFFHFVFNFINFHFSWISFVFLINNFLFNFTEFVCNLLWYNNGPPYENIFNNNVSLSCICPYLSSLFFLVLHFLLCLTVSILVSCSLPCGFSVSGQAASSTWQRWFQSFGLSRLSNTTWATIYSSVVLG